MPTVARWANFRPEFLDANANPLVGGKLFFYQAGTNTKRDSYNSVAGTVANTNPIILNSRGEPGTEVWLDTTYLYKVVLAPATDTDPPSSAIWIENDIDPINRVNPNFQGSNLTWGPTVAIPDSGTYFEVTGGSGAASTMSSISANGREISIKFNVGSLTLTHNPPALTLQGGVSRTIAASDVVSFIKQTGGWIEQCAKELPSNIAQAADFAYGNLTQSGSRLILPRGYISGCEISNNILAAATDIDFAVGQCRDSTNTVNIILSSGLTKQLNNTWAPGTNQGGLDTGAVGNNTYHCFLIRNNSTGAIDALFSLSATSPTMPSGYTYFRRVGSILRESGSIVAFSQFGNRFDISLDGVAPTTLTNAVTTATLIAMRVPTGISVRATIQGRTGGSVDHIAWITSPGAANVAPSSTPFSGNLYFASTTGPAQFDLEVVTDTSGQIRYRKTTASSSAADLAYVTSWVDSLL
jgi:hypothetical protein